MVEAAGRWQQWGASCEGDEPKGDSEVA
eukprot:SAG25_NODE_5610_length_639_cov_0.925926_1_plen_27_part_10